MCNTIKKPPVLVLASNDGVNLFAEGVPQCVLDEASNSPLTTYLEGNGQATVDVGATPTVIPWTGWTMTAGTDSGFRGGRVEAEFSGAGLGVGAAGYFTINTSNGLLSSLVITAQGSGHSGVITARPRRTNPRRVVFDLGNGWDQYGSALLSFVGFGTDRILRGSIGCSRTNKGVQDFHALNELAGNEAWLQPLGGGQPTRRILLAGRYLHLTLMSGAEIPSAACVYAAVMPT